RDGGGASPRPRRSRRACAGGVIRSRRAAAPRIPLVSAGSPDLPRTSGKRAGRRTQVEALGALGDTRTLLRADHLEQASDAVLKPVSWSAHERGRRCQRVAPTRTRTGQRDQFGGTEAVQRSGGTARTSHRLRARQSAMTSVGTNRTARTKPSDNTIRSSTTPKRVRSPE